MVQQTAVQSFWNKIALQLSVEQINKFLPEFQQAKEMEKEQIIRAYIDGYIGGERYDETPAEDYYKEKYIK